MAVAAASKYLAILDKSYKKLAKSSILDVNPAWVREADVAGTFYLPELVLIGFGDYSTSTGFPDGQVNLTWVAYTYSQDRAREFSVDAVADAEGAFVAFANLAAEFNRAYGVPEVDAYRFAAIATAAGKDATGTLSDAAAVVAALNTAMDTLDEAEVDDDNKVLFITAGLLRLARNAANTAATTDALDRATVVVVPKTRFYTALTLDAGASAAAGGYSNNGAQLNFILMDKGAVFADAKHQALRTFSPNGEGGYPINQDKDGWLFQVRLCHDCWPYNNRLNGIYVHSAT